MDKQFVTSVHDRRKYVDSSFDTPASQRGLFSSKVISDSHVSACPNLLLCPGSPHPNVLEIRIGWDEKLWLANEAQPENFPRFHAPLLVRSG